MTSTIVRLTLVVLLGGLTLCPSTSHAQRIESIARPQAGLYGAYQIVQHTYGTSVGIVGLPSCGTFTDGNGNGVAIGLLYQLPIATRLAVQLRGTYSSMHGSLTSREVIGNGVENGAVVDAEVEYSLEPSLGIASLEPMIVWAPFDFPLSINLGIQAGTVLSKTATQKETLLTPRTATFVGGSAGLNEGSGDFDAADFYAASITGLSYDIPVARNIVVAPEVAYHFNVNNAGSAAPWRGDALRLGASLKMLIAYPASETSGSRPYLNAEVRASGLYADSSERPMVQVRIEEFLGTQLRPLLNYIFFDDNSSTIPQRYTTLSQTDARGFSVDNLHYLDALHTYYQILNIIGRRMTEYPEATIQLTGCNAQAGNEKDNTQVAQARAVAVRDYLTTTWNIAPSRIAVEQRGLPAKPSNATSTDGIEENRRVEITASDNHILEPVLTNDTLRTANPPGIRFRSTMESEAGAASWRLTAGQLGRTLKEFTGSGEVPEVIDWHLEQDQATVPRFPEPIDYTLAVTDAGGHTYSTPAAQIPTDQMTVQRKRRERIANKEINRYSLILFDVGSAEIDAGNRRIVDFIRNRITINSTVAVTGYTDRSGDEDFNLRLSEQRARATTTALGVGKPSGAGETMLFDNNLPEGRFYCRTVNVVVETPVTE